MRNGCQYSKRWREWGTGNNIVRDEWGTGVNIVTDGMSEEWVSI